MKKLWKKYLPKPNPWFIYEFSYEGIGKATFKDPRGSIEGKTKITVNRAGKLHVEMEMERLNAPRNIDGNEHFRISKFLHRSKQKGNTVSIGFSEENRNVCKSLSIQTKDGIFMADGRIYWSDGFWGNSNKLTFHISGGTFHQATHKKAKYWACPLENFVSVFRDVHPSLNNHPLRIFQTPKLSRIAKEEKQYASWYANSRNHLIIFKFGKELGFIEALPDYSDIEKLLKSGENKQSITALMVGTVNSESIGRWFPYNYVNLLTFLSGAETNAPWIEFRDKKGGLVKRKHLWSRRLDYKKEYEATDETFDHGIGRLLSLANKSREFKKTYYHVLINHLIRLSPYSRHIEDAMALLARTFDTLCEHHKFGTQSLVRDLTPATQENINQILKQAASRVRVLSKKAVKEGNGEARALNRIEGKISNAKNIDRDFGLAVSDLLNFYELSDMKIMDGYYSQINSKYKTWAGLLTAYRGAAIHAGYFQVQNGKHDFHNVLQTINHLHDILVRIALKILKYEGPYQPRVIAHAVTDTLVNWVNEETDLTSLGYKNNTQ